MSGDEEVSLTWTHTFPAVEAGSLMVLACRCGILHTLTVSAEAGVAQIDCPCGVVATLPVDGSPPARGVGYPNNRSDGANEDSM
jgi:hypothetical protein